jgi:NTE family protein
MLMIKICLFFLLFAGCSSMSSTSDHAHVIQFEPAQPIRIALVLGGGGAKGIAHLGAIQELEKAGIRPDLIVGCSAGAIVGAFYADNPSLAKTDELFLSLKKADLIDTSFFSSRFGFVQGKKLQKFMQKNLSSQKFDELKIPLIGVATDLFTGETVELSQGTIPMAINASCAVPGFFNPVFLHNRHLVDGGVASPLPIEIAKKYGAELIIAIDVSEELPTSKPSHFFGVARRSLEIAYLKLIAHSLEKADISIKMNFQDVGMFNEELNHHMYKEGQAQALKMLPAINNKMAILSSRC